MPVQLSPLDLVAVSSGVPALTPLLSSGAIEFSDGMEINGYWSKDVTQAPVTATHFFDQVMGADRLTLVGEV